MDKNTEQELQKKLQEKERELELKRRFGGKHNKYVESAIRFFGTMVPLYLLFYLIEWIFMFNFGIAVNFLGVSIDWFYPLIHGFIWVASVYSVYRNRSILDDLYKRI